MPTYYILLDSELNMLSFGKYLNFIVLMWCEKDKFYSIELFSHTTQTDKALQYTKKKKFFFQ